MPMKKILLLIVCLLCLAFSFSDSSGLKILILNKLNEYSSRKYPEKIYIHTDKPYYTAGENIWFNTYLVNGVTHTKTNKSKVIYVELINDQDSIISGLKLFAESISVKGDFKLPIDLKDGNYLLRAYTNYMRNQSSDYYFKKEIPIFAINSQIIDTVNNSDLISQENSEMPDIGFYPEGGYLVNGINNKVAIKIKDADLDASPIVGIIEDAQGNKITDFKTFEFGLGYFNLKPEPGKEYRAVITSGDEDLVYALPKPLSEGYVMNTSLTENEVVINLTTNKPEGFKNTLLIGHQRGLAAFDYAHEKNTGTMLVKIPKEDLIEGVLDIVFFDQSQQPVAERLVYIKKEESISISLKKKNIATIGARERVNLEIEVTDKFGKIIPSNLSLSVTDAELIKPNNNAENIKTYFLLNSDLRGKIKSPNYFFQSGDEIKKAQLLDLIMLTHGWRRFTWQEFSKNSLFQEFKPEDGIYIKGNTISSTTPFKTKLSETKLTFRKDGFVQETQNTDENGFFSYGPYIFNDEIGVLLQAGERLSSEQPNYTDTNIKLRPSIQAPEIESYKTIATFRQESPTVEAYKEKAKKIVAKNFKFDKDRELLDEVNIKTTRITKEEIDEIKRKRRTQGALEPSYRIIVDDFGMHGGGDFMELIANLPGIRIGKKYDAETSQDVVITLRGLDPEYYLDGIKVTLPIMRSISQANIDFIDVRNVGHSSANFALAAGGVIAIYTKQGSRHVDNSKITNRKGGSISFILNGFYSAREFYAPDYSFEDRNSIRADNRTTLYWQPNIVTEDDKSATVYFYTSDDKGRFQIEIEGISNSGIPIHETSILNVE